MNAACDVDIASSSVRLSRTLWYCVKTAKHIGEEVISPLDRPVIVVFLEVIDVTKFGGFTRDRDGKKYIQEGIKYCGFQAVSYCISVTV